MFESFFPKPKIFFPAFAAWAIFCVIVWFFMAKGAGGTFSIGWIFGYEFLPVPEAGADEEAVAAHAAAIESANTFWFYQFMIVSYAVFLAFWQWYLPHKWGRWSLYGSALILFVTWFQVQLDVMINEWFGSFYDLIQNALAEPDSVTTGDYFSELFTFAQIALVAITVAVLTNFFVSHYIFRWRTAMNDRYVEMWGRVRHIEGAAQRVQEDTMRFAAIMESLGVRLIDSVMTLIAFLPILWGLSSFVKVLRSSEKFRRPWCSSRFSGRSSVRPCWPWPESGCRVWNSAISVSRRRTERNWFMERMTLPGLNLRPSASCSETCGETTSASI